MALALWVLPAASSAAKPQIKMTRGIAISDLKGAIRLGCACFSGQRRLPHGGPHPLGFVLRLPRRLRKPAYRASIPPGHMRFALSKPVAPDPTQTRSY